LTRSLTRSLKRPLPVLEGTSRAPLSNFPPPTLEGLRAGRDIAVPLESPKPPLLRATAPALPKPGRPEYVAFARLIVGRAKLRDGGVPAARCPPTIAVLLGRASTERTALILLRSFGDTRMLLRATCCELTSVLRETAVKPLGACIFA